MNSADAMAELESLLAATQRRTPVERPRPRELDSRLHAYQVEAVGHLHANPRAGLFLEMGLGKTATILQAITKEHAPILVVAPKRVAENVWTVEGSIWRPDLSIQIAAGDPKKRAAALASDADVVVIGRDNLKDVPIGKFRTVVLDELSSFKNRGTARWKLAKKICTPAAYVWGLTGTPVPNGLMDLWAQVALLDDGQRLGRTLTGYRQRYFAPGRQLPTGVIIEWRLREGSQTAIENKISDICLSMRAEHYLDLPPVTRNIVTVPMDAKTRRIYADMQANLTTQIEERDHAAANSAVLTAKLSQITAGFIYADIDDPDSSTTALHDNKTAAAIEIVEGTGSPVLIFYRFTEELDRLRAGFKKAGIGARTVDEKGVIEDWNKGEVPVLLAHPASAGHGLNLQHGGHTIIWTTLPNCDLEQWDQANARVARQGQTHPVVIHILETPDSVDGEILGSLDGKWTTQDAVMHALGVAA